MKTAVFSAKKYDCEFLSAANGSRHELHFFEPHLNEKAVGLAAGFGAVRAFVNDQVNAAVIARLHSSAVRLIALRCAGYNKWICSGDKIWHQGLTRAGVLALRSGRAHDCSDAGA
jgi:lactate dehydrogenase-like 2-hydroxyacid dehydrogenase